MFIENSLVTDPIIRSLNLLPDTEVYQFIQHVCNVNTPVSLGFVNQYAYNLMAEDNEIRDYFSRLTYRLRDGGGIKVACMMKHCDPGANLNGTDLIPKICDCFLSNHPYAQVFVFGTQEPWLSLGAEKLLKGMSCHKLDGFQDDQAYLDLIHLAGNTCSHRLIILAMGMPKQERIAKLLMEKLQGSLLIICGGAIVDFSAGKISRAPKLLRSLSLEWLYRLSLEPKRLFSRYVLGIPLFFYFLLKKHT